MDEPATIAWKYAANLICEEDLPMLAAHLLAALPRLSFTARPGRPFPARAPSRDPPALRTHHGGVRDPDPGLRDR